MAEEVKIVDVAGGPAAEATLQELLRVMKGKAGGGSGGGASGSDTKAQELYTSAVTRGTKTRKENTSAVKDATDATNMFSSTLGTVGGLVGSALGGIVGVARNFTDALTNATTIGGVLEAVPVFGSVLSSATGYFQNGIDTFRQLSDVGAGFGNDMMAMRNAAAASGLSLEQFASMIGNNSTTMGLLGGTTSDGAARMGRLTKALRSQEMGLMSLGYTQESLNEGMAEYLENQALAGQLRGRSDRDLIAGAQGYLTELDKLSRVTGKSRKELQDAMRSNAEVANVAVIRSRLEGESLQNFDNNMAHITTMLPGLGDAFKDLSDGVAQSPFARILESNIPGMKALAEANARGELSQEEFQARMAEMTPQIRDFISSMRPERVEALMGREGFGELMNTIGEVTTYTQRQADAVAAAEEQARRAPLTDLFANFEQTIQNIRSTFEDAFIESGVLDFIGTELGEGGENLLTGFQAIADNVKEYLGSEQFKKDFDMVKAKIQEFKNTIMGFINDVKEVGFVEAIKNLFAGDGGTGIDIGGMFGDFIGSAFSSLLPSLDTVLVGLAAGIAALIFAPVAAPFLAIGAALAAMFGYETIKGWVSDAWDGITGVFTSIGEWFSTSRIREKLVEAWDSVTGVFSGITDWWLNTSIGEMLSNAWNSVTGVFSSIGEWWDNFSFGTFVDNTLVTIWDSAAAAFGSIGEWFSNFSLSETLNNMWNTVTGWFSFGGDGESSFSISALGEAAWNVVTGWFSLQADLVSGIASLFTSAWDTVTSWFSFGDLEIPSISDMFSGIIDRVSSFFDFDFEMPDFTDYLPTWLGGEGKSLFGGDEPGTTATAAVSNPEQEMPEIEQPANVAALGELNFASQVEAAQALKAELADIGSMQSFNTELERLQSGLDTTAVTSYTNAMSRLVDVLENLNEVLAEDNEGMLGGGTGVSAASMLSSGQLGGGSSSGSEETMNRLNMLVAQLVSLQEENNRYSRGTMRAVNGNLQLGV